MRNLIALAALLASQIGHSAASASRNVQAHVSVSDAGEYSATVSSAGEPTTLWVRSRGESIELRIQFQDPTRLHYEVRRVGERQFHLSGAITPPFGHPFVIGHFPVFDGFVDIKLWLTDR
jgi:hypothetical protein